MRIFLLNIMVAVFLAGCGSYGVSYQKPTYNRIGSPDDPVIFFESEFDTNTQFMAKIHNVSDDPKCLIGANRVAYLQEMDSYFRKKDLPGPWKITAPVDRYILISGNWFTYGTSYSSVLGGIKTTTYRKGESCKPVVKIFMPKAKEEYVVRLTSAGDKVCAMDITYKDGRPVDVIDAKICQKWSEDGMSQSIPDMFKPRAY